MAFFLPVRLLTLAFGLCFPTFTSASPAHRARSAAAVLTIAALLTVMCALPDAGSNFSSEAEALRSEIGELRLKLAWLESILEENTLRSKPFILEGDNKLTEALEYDAEILMNKEESSKKFQRKLYSERNIYIMEDELQSLQQEVRKINDIAYSIESLAIDAEKRVEFLGSEVKKIDSIIAEQWIQIRQLEQAFVLTKTMTSQVYARRLSENPYKLLAKDIVLKVQMHVEGAMRSNRYSRRLASELITSWLAYLVVISPIWIAWFLFSLRFG